MQVNDCHTLDAMNVARKLPKRVNADGASVPDVHLAKSSNHGIPARYF